MSLRDEWGNFQSFVHDRHPALHHDGFAGNSTLFAEWLAVRMAAERAAVIEECDNICSDVTAALCEGNEDCQQASTGSSRCMMAIRNLPRDRSALEDATKMAAGQVRHEMNQKIGEHLGQDANEKSLLQMLDDALAQARREQREKDATKAESYAIYEGDIAYEIAAAIRAQED